MSGNNPRKSKVRPQAQPATPSGGDMHMNPGDEAIAGTPGTGEAVCPECRGSGRLGGTRCPNCGGSGKVVRAIGGA